MVTIKQKESDARDANTRLTAHFMCGLMFDLAICKFKKKYGHT